MGFQEIGDRSDRLAQNLHPQLGLTRNFSHFQHLLVGRKTCDQIAEVCTIGEPGAAFDSCLGEIDDTSRSPASASAPPAAVAGQKPAVLVPPAARDAQDVLMDRVVVVELRTPDLLGVENAEWYTNTLSGWSSVFVYATQSSPSWPICFAKTPFFS